MILYKEPPRRPDPRSLDEACPKATHLVCVGLRWGDHGRPVYRIEHRPGTAHRFEVEAEGPIACAACGVLAHV